MALWLRRFRHLSVPGGLLLVACAGDKPADPALQRRSEWQARSDEAAREEQAREDAAAAELQQAVLAIENAPPDTLSEGQFFQVLEYHCGSCHFPAPVTGGGEQPYWLFFDDLARMIERSNVIPGDAEGSRLIEYMHEDHVPPDSGFPAIPEVAVRLVADFIDQLAPELDKTSGG